jgi:hypothetical protein
MFPTIFVHVFNMLEAETVGWETSQNCHNYNMKKSKKTFSHSGSESVELHRNQVIPAGIRKRKEKVVADDQELMAESLERSSRLHRQPNSLILNFPS